MIRSSVLYSGPSLISLFYFYKGAKVSSRADGPIVKRWGRNKTHERTKQSNSAETHLKLKRFEIETVNFEWHLLKINCDGADEPLADRETRFRCSQILHSARRSAQVEKSIDQNSHCRAPGGSPSVLVVVTCHLQQEKKYHLLGCLFVLHVFVGWCQQIHAGS